MYRIIGEPYYKNGNRRAKMVCSCGHIAHSTIIGSKLKGFKPISFECNSCANTRRFGTLKERLNNYKINKNGCHIWQGSFSTNGYAVLGLNSKVVNTHRLVWELANRKLNKEVVRHKCDNPKCINLDHLEIGTNKDNSNDMIIRGRSLKGEKNNSVKLFEKDILDIKASNKSSKKLAKLFNVTIGHINKIKTNKIWRHLNDT